VQPQTTLNNQGEKNMATWHNRTWTFDLSIAGANLTQPAPASNQFTLVPSRDTNQDIYLYTIVPATANSIAPLWVGRILLPQGGLPLKKNIPLAERLDPAATGYLDKLEHIATDIGDNLIKQYPFQFERLVGTVTINGKESPVAFYQMEKAFKANGKLLLFVDVDLIGAAPHGTVSGNG